MASSQPRVYAALLRGVNVGGRNKLPNAALQAACARAGFGNVRTYLQSGNVVFTAAGDRANVAARLAEAIAEQTKLTVTVLLRTADELATLVARHPFGASDRYDASRVAVAFLGDTLPAAVQAKLRALCTPAEELKFGQLELFAYFPDGMGKSKLANALHDKTLGVPCTVRNWNTVSALAKLAR